ncbi:MAG: hypothetical protein H0T79_08355 [Deltaproteobacteria bacterium]|nr:hypothetical protein [Deltaproteobacteria bacterium]
MRQRVGLITVLALFGLVFGVGPLWADEDEDKAGSAEPAPATPGDSDGDGKPDEAAPAADKNGDGKPDVAGDADHDGKPDVAGDADHDGKPDVAPVGAPDDGDKDHDGKVDQDGDLDNDGVKDTEEAGYDPEDPPTDPFDEDGDGVVEPDEVAMREENNALFKDIPDDVDDAALEGRSEDSELTPSITVEDFRKLVRITKKIVLDKMEKKIAHKSAQKMQKFSLIVVGFSALGLLLLLMPLALGKKYPGQGALLFKYSALAALVFIVTVNMFGGVIYGFRIVQGAMSSYTNPSTAIAAGTFDTLDDNADSYVTTGKELFGPSLDQMKKDPDAQPAAILIENGMKVVQDAKVFMSIAKLFKKVDFIFGILPIVLMAVTLLLFVLAIRPTLTEIVKLPAAAAAGNATAGKDVMKKSMGRVIGELKATVCTIGILIVLTLISGAILGQIVKPAIGALLEYFSLAVSYLQFVEGASSGMVFMTLFGVILFLILNLATLILSMAFFLGKSQKIFQQRFNEGTPLATHTRFFKWGVPSVLLVQVFPLLFVIVAGKGLAWLNDSSREGILDAEKVSWSKILLSGPLFLVVAFIILFWAVRGLKAIKFLATYKVKAKPSAVVDPVTK